MTDALALLFVLLLALWLLRRRRARKARSAVALGAATGLASSPVAADLVISRHRAPHRRRWAGSRGFM